MVNSNIGPNWAPLQDIRLATASNFDFDSDLDFDFQGHSRSKSFGLPIYGSLLMFNSNIGPN